MSVAAGTAVRARRSSRADGRRGYFDPKFDRFAIKVHPGEHYLTAQNDEMLVTVLGSCVSACIRDPGTGFGGMNHFMLPESETGQWGASSAAMRYGNHAMEMLINAVISSGCPRHRLEIKLFGGSNVTGGTSGIGDQNAEFILRYMKNEGLSIAAMDLGGVKPRRIHYFPETGQVKRLFVGQKDRRNVADVEQSFRRKITDTPVGGDVELFS